MTEQRWFKTALCRNRRACRDCRTLASFRASLHVRGMVDSPDFDCPHRITAADVTKEGWGTKLERVIAKIPGVKRLPCYGEDGKLKPQSGCAKKRDWLDGKSR